MNPRSLIDARAFPELRSLKTASEETEVSRSADRDNSAPYDHRLVKALEHPLRADFLRLLAKRRILSARQALPLIDGGTDLDRLVYQTRLLVELGLIEPAGEPDPRIGVPFRLTSEGRRAVVALGVPGFDEESPD
jgi:hypothetical protein